MNRPYSEGLRKTQVNERPAGPRSRSFACGTYDPTFEPLYWSAQETDLRRQEKSPPNLKKVNGRIAFTSSNVIYTINPDGLAFYNVTMVLVSDATEPQITFTGQSGNYVFSYTGV